MMRIGVVWLSQTWPIRRRLKLFVGGRVVLSLPLRSVEWSRGRSPEDLDRDEER